jgi:ribosomal protein L1
MTRNLYEQGHLSVCFFEEEKKKAEKSLRNDIFIFTVHFLKSIKSVESQRGPTNLMMNLKKIYTINLK